MRLQLAAQKPKTWWRKNIKFLLAYLLVGCWICVSGTGQNLITKAFVEKSCGPYQNYNNVNGKQNKGQNQFSSNLFQLYILKTIWKCWNLSQIFIKVNPSSALQCIGSKYCVQKWQRNDPAATDRLQSKMVTGETPFSRSEWFSRKHQDLSHWTLGRHSKK